MRKAPTTTRALARNVHRMTTFHRLIEQLRERDLNLLVILRVLLHTASVSRAAEQLGFTQPAVSRMLERLRSTFGDPLLVRSGNRMLLTERARELISELDAAFGHLDRVFGAAGAFNPATVKRSIVVGANEYLQTVFAAPLIRAMQTSAPKVQLKFEPVASSDTLRRLEDGGTDLALCIVPGELPTLRSQILFEETFVGVCCIDNRSIAPHMGVSELSSVGHIDVSPSGTGLLASLIDRHFAAHHMQRRCVATLSSYFSLALALSGSDLISLVPRMFAHTAANALGLRVVQLDDDFPCFNVGMYWHNVSHYDDFHGWFREQVVRIVGG